MCKFLEYDVIELTSSLSGADIPIGAHGTVLIVHPGNPAAYVIEFVSDDGSTLGVETIDEDKLRLVIRPANT